MRIVRSVAVLLLVVSVLVTATRFLAVGWRPAAAVASVSSYAAAGFWLAALLALVVLVRTGRRGPAVLLVLALLGAAAHVVWAAPAYVRDGAGAGDQRLRLVTANLRFGEADPRTLVDLVARERVQVLVLEELTPPELERFRALGLTSRLPYAAGSPSYAADGTVVLSSLPLTGARRLPIGNGALEVLAGRPGEQVRLLAVHTVQPFDDAPGWAGDLRTLRREVRGALGSTGAPVVVAGDLNATTGHRLLRDVLGEGLTDAVDAAGAGWQPTWPNGYGFSWTRPVVAIDHVLTGPGARTLATRTVDQPGSDHRALLAVIAR